MKSSGWVRGRDFGRRSDVGTMGRAEGTEAERERSRAVGQEGAEPGETGPQGAAAVEGGQDAGEADEADRERVVHGVGGGQPPEEGDDARAGHEAEGPDGHEGERFVGVPPLSSSMMPAAAAGTSPRARAPSRESSSPAPGLNASAACRGSAPDPIPDKNGEAPEGRSPEAGAA